VEVVLKVVELLMKFDEERWWNNYEWCFWHLWSCHWYQCLWKYHYSSCCCCYHHSLTFLVVHHTMNDEKMNDGCCWSIEELMRQYWLFGDMS